MFLLLKGCGSSGPIVNLRWTASQTPNVTYDVYRSIHARNTYALVGSGISGISFNDLSVSSGTQYDYQVTAENVEHVQSIRSNTFSITVP